MSTRAAACFAVATAALTAVVLIQALRRPDDPNSEFDGDFVALSVVTAAVLLAVFLTAAFTRRLSFDLRRGFPWLIGGVSLVLAFVPWSMVNAGRAEFAAAFYRGLQLPQGIVPFWDMRLVLESIDCAHYGFDVFESNNGCLKDPAIYGPGVLWLQYVPFRAFSEDHAVGIGLVALLVSSLFLVWLARSSEGPGQVVLLVAALGAPWQLLLERGNFEAALLWGACVTVILVRRWDRLWAWSLAAAVIWFLGTWKYYPFAMGLMLLPVLRLRRGWTVLAGYAIASTAFMLIAWDNFQFSTQSNNNMVDIRDWVTLGRLPVVVRMLGGEVGTGIHLQDVVVFALAIAAIGWGVAVGLVVRRRLVHPAMLAVAGSSMFLAPVLVAGFGFAYKAPLLLLCVPLVAALTRSSRTVVVASSVAVLALIAIVSFIVNNTMLATLAGVIAASFALGLSLVLLVRCLRKQLPQRERAGLGSGNHAVTG
jgi:hypothetical protein